MAARYPGGSVSPGLRFRPQAAGARGLQYRPGYTPMNPWRQTAAGGLQGLGGLLMALGAGQPQQALPAFQGGLAAQDEAERRRAEQAREDELFAFEREDRAASKAERDRERREAEATRAAWQPVMARLSDADPSNDPTSLRDILPFLPIEAQMQMAGELFPEPKGASSGVGKIMEDLRAGLIDQATADALLRKETYIAPQQGDGTWERYVDPTTGRTGQRNSRTGKIDWDPGNTMLAQVGTDAQGNPIYDFVGAPGPTKEHEVKAANQSLLLSQGIDELERLYSDKEVSAARIAGSDQLAEFGPLGGVVGQKIMTPSDKQFVSGRARALESLANTITGAAFTAQQKQNFIAMLPQPTDDAETARIKIAQARAYIKELETNAKVGDRRQDSPESPDADGYTIEELP